MAKITLTDKQISDYEDKDNCFGKMYDEKEPDCTSCGDCDVCKSLIAGDTPKAAKKDTDKPESKAKITREIVIAIFNKVMDSRGIPHEVVSAANHDKLYMNGDYLGKATTSALYIDEESEKYANLNMDDVEVIFTEIDVEIEEVVPVVEKVEEPIGKIHMMYTVDDIQKMTVSDFIKLVLQ